jgi:COP9 signalosome complex subunit 7
LDVLSEAKMEPETDFAFTTRIDEAPAPAATTSRAAAVPAGPSFATAPRLEPFLLLAKSARGAGAAKLIEEAVAAPGVFSFGELLDMPNLKDVCAYQHSLPNL